MSILNTHEMPTFKKLELDNFCNLFLSHLIFFSSSETEIFSLDFLKQGQFMHHLAALCKQFVLEFPETQCVIYIANCNTFFCVKAPLDFTNLFPFFFFSG